MVGDCGDEDEGTLVSGTLVVDISIIAARTLYCAKQHEGKGCDAEARTWFSWIQWPGFLVSRERRRSNCQTVLHVPGMLGSFCHKPHLIGLSNWRLPIGFWTSIV